MLARDRQVATRHELTTRPGRQGVHARDDRLGYLLERAHHPGAGLEEAANAREVLTRHLGEIMTGAEETALGGDDDPGGVAVTRRRHGVGHLEHQRP